MIRNYFTRIISQVVRKLLYPELVEIRGALERIVGQQQTLVERGSQWEAQKNEVDFLTLSNELGATFSEAIAGLKNKIDDLKSEVEDQIQEKVCREIATGNDSAEQRDARQNQELAELRGFIESSYERIHKRDASQGEKIADLLGVTERSFSTLDQEIEQIRSRLADDMKALNKQIDDLYKIVVKREEHTFLISDVQGLKQEVERLKQGILRKGSDQKI